MSDARNFGPVAEQMAEALQRYSKEELIDLLTHIVKTYVVEGTLPLKPEVGTHIGDEHLASLSFPQLVLHHQMQLDHREWQMFSVSGEDVWVTSGGQRINLTARPGALPAPSGRSGGGEQGYMEPVPSSERTPAPSTAPAVTAADAARSAAPAAAPPPVDTAPTQAERAADKTAAENELPEELKHGTRVPEPFGEDVEESERFGMLEID